LAIDTRVCYFVRQVGGCRIVARQLTPPFDNRLASAVHGRLKKLRVVHAFNFFEASHCVLAIFPGECSNNYILFESSDDATCLTALSTNQRTHQEQTVAAERHPRAAMSDGMLQAAV